MSKNRKWSKHLANRYVRVKARAQSKNPNSEHTKQHVTTNT